MKHWKMLLGATVGMLTLATEETVRQTVAAGAEFDPAVLPGEIEIRVVTLRDFKLCRKDIGWCAKGIAQSCGPEKAQQRERIHRRYGLMVRAHRWNWSKGT